MSLCAKHIKTVLFTAIADVISLGCGDSLDAEITALDTAPPVHHENLSICDLIYHEPVLHFTRLPYNKSPHNTGPIRPALSGFLRRYFLTLGRNIMTNKTMNQFNPISTVTMMRSPLGLAGCAGAPGLSQLSTKIDAAQTMAIEPQGTANEALIRTNALQGTQNEAITRAGTARQTGDAAQRTAAQAIPAPTPVIGNNNKVNQISRRSIYASSCLGLCDAGSAVQWLCGFVGSRGRGRMGRLRRGRRSVRFQAYYSVTLGHAIAAPPTMLGKMHISYTGGLHKRGHKEFIYGNTADGIKVSVNSQCPSARVTKIEMGVGLMGNKVLSQQFFRLLSPRLRAHTTVTPPASRN